MHHVRESGNRLKLQNDKKQAIHKYNVYMFLQELYVHVYKDCLRKWCFQNKQTKTSNDQTVDIAYYIHT